MLSIKIRKYYFRAIAVFFFFEILISKSFSIKKVKIESIIRSSGIVEFNENRTFDFRGKFSYAYQDIPKKFYRNIYDIAVSEGGIPYKNINSSEPKTFQIIENKNSFRIKWFHESENTQKDFLLSYKVKGSLKIGPDDSQFFWGYIGKNWKKSNNQISIIQRFEKNISPEDVWYEALSKRKKLDTGYHDQDHFRLDVNKIRKNRGLVLNTIFPTSYLIDAQINDNTFNKYEYLENKKLKEEKSKIGFNSALFIILISLCLFIFRIVKYGKEYNIKENFRGNTGAFPSEHHHSLVSYLITKQKVSGLAILGSVFSLANKKHFIIKEKKIEKKSIFGNKTENKIEISKGEIGHYSSDEKWDRVIFNFIVKFIDGKPKFLDDIFGNMVYNSIFMKDLNASINNKLKELGWIEYPPRSATFVYSILHSILFFCSIMIVVYNIPASIIATITVCLFGIIGSLSINRMSIECSKIRNKWKGFSILLDKNSDLYKNLDGNKLIQYAIVLGLGPYEMKNLLKNFDYSSSGDFHWFYGGDYGGSNIDTFSSMIDTGNALSANFANDGGGADGGGGGGGGGGAG